ncbi:unnamed protein product [Enterobius vermicularis]|uniref:Uncharacterized protein n=1 Tax=Enterobius vermicularis TaxID=51028 RepID=A0A0N4V681_ENTVE|nr:unnamed protein product [Enterobius vermicularis]
MEIKDSSPVMEIKDSFPVMEIKDSFPVMEIKDSFQPIDIKGNSLPAEIKCNFLATGYSNPRGKKNNLRDRSNEKKHFATFSAENSLRSVTNRVF